jgi:signal transduction histidine kinase
MPFKISIFYKMLIAPLLAVALFALFIINIYFQQIEGKEYIESIYQKHFPILNIANENRILLDNIIKLTEDAVVANEQTWLNNTKEYKEKIEKNFKDLSKLDIDEKTIFKMQTIFIKYFSKTIELSTLMINNSEDWNKIEILTKEMTSYLEDTRTIFQSFQEEQNLRLQDTIDTTNKYGEKIVYLGIILGVLSLALIIIITMFLSFSTKNSLKELLDSVKNIARGNPDFTKRIKKSSDDELGELVSEFNSFTKKLQGDYEELALAKADAETANKIKSEFVANISHEIRTPLNAIIGFSELLNKTEVTLKQKSYLESIKTGGDTLFAIISDILDISKIEAGKLEIQYEEVSLNLILKDIEKIFLQKLKDKELDLKIDFDSNIPLNIFIDDIRLRQILLNILGNAIKFTNKGSIKINLLSSNFKNNRFDLQIDIEDTGIGIPKEQQSKIFESFVQKDGQSNRQYGGTGLGLSICLKLIKMMNGNIKVKSEEGIGSTFSIILKDLEIVDSQKVIENIKKDEVFLKKPTIYIDEKIKDIFNKNFEESIQRSWKKASQGCSVEDIQEFLRNLNIFAREYEQIILLDFVKSMNIAIENFDIKTLESQILEFSKFLNEIEKETNDE